MYRLAILNSHPIQYFAPLYRRLAQEPDIDLTVYFCSSQGLEEYRDPGFGVSFKWDVPLLQGYRARFLPNLRRDGSVAGFFSLINPSIVRELRRERYDALWVHGHAYATFILAMVAAKLLGIPVLMRCETHLLLQRSPLKRALRRLLMRVLYTQLCSACLPIGTRNKEFYLEHGVDERHLFLVPYTVDNDYFARRTEDTEERSAALRRELGLPPGKPVILFASKLMPRKRPMDLLVAYHRLRTRSIHACLVFVGSGEEEAALRRYAAEYQVSDVHFGGFRNQSELPDFYHLADMFVLPSENEPWGLIINEVMAAGLPVIATEEIGAAADLVKHGENGFVYSAGDVDALSRHLETLVLDRSLCQRMAQHSRGLIDSWDFGLCVHGVREALAAPSCRLEPAPAAAGLER
jgi:glycosyltransferase involved in cell wall biosynthesis